MSLLMETTAHTLGATPKSAHAALLLFCPIFTCAVSYVTQGECTHTHTLYSKMHRMHAHTAAHHATPHHAEAAVETRYAWLGQLSYEVSYADWTYADPVRYFFCADFLVGASLCHDFVLSFVCRRGVKWVEELVCSV